MVADTRAQINAWLAGWADPQNLIAIVRDDSGEIASKATGRRTLVWDGQTKGAV